jgi:hypothetical protein
MAASEEPVWTAIYETHSASDADLVRTTLEVAGYKVSVEGANTDSSFIPSYGTPGKLTIAVPAGDADDAREFLKQKTSLLDASPARLESTVASNDMLREEIKGLADEVWDVRTKYQAAPCKYCGIATLDVSERELDSRMIALLRAAGLGVNSATFSDFEPGERICSECAGHEVNCDTCGRVTDAFLDEGEYVRAKDDEAYICNSCWDRLLEELEPQRDW